MSIVQHYRPASHYRLVADGALHTRRVTILRQLRFLLIAPPFSKTPIKMQTKAQLAGRRASRAAFQGVVPRAGSAARPAVTSGAHVASDISCSARIVAGPGTCAVPTGSSRKRTACVVAAAPAAEKREFIRDMPNGHRPFARRGPHGERRRGRAAPRARSGAAGAAKPRPTAGWRPMLGRRAQLAHELYAVAWAATN